jgi:hypothetical protein
VLLGTKVQKRGTIELDARSGVLAMEYPERRGDKISKTTEIPKSLAERKWGRGGQTTTRTAGRMRDAK